jgi:N-acetyltransferase
MIDPQPLVLQGTVVRLEPLTLAHGADLWPAAQPAEIWTWLAAARPETQAALEEWVRSAVAEMESKSKVWFAIVRHSDGLAVGVTSYMDIRRMDRGLEIGGTWLAPAVWRTALNTECKYLLLRHAFETIGCLRVQLKTDARNVRSQSAIERLGAVREGVLRKHMILPNEYVRDTVMYSITDTEWPAVKARLEGFLRQFP